MRAKLTKNIVHRLDGEKHIFPEGLDVNIVENDYGSIMEVDNLRFLIRTDEYELDK